MIMLVEQLRGGRTPSSVVLLAFLSFPGSKTAALHPEMSESQEEKSDGEGEKAKPTGPAIKPFSGVSFLFAILVHSLGSNQLPMPTCAAKNCHTKYNNHTLFPRASPYLPEIKLKSHC